MSKPINYKCQLGTEAHCKLLLHMNEASWNGTPDEVKDASGCGNHGQAFGGVTTIAGGKFGRCGSFNGSGDYINCGDPVDGSLDFGTGDFSISAWIKPQDTTGKAEYFINKGDNTVNRCSLKVAGNRIEFQIRESDGVPNVSNTFSYTPDNWYHIAGTFDGTNIRLYINGTLEDTDEISGVNITNNFNLLIGGFGIGSLFFNGAIDEVCIYNRAKNAQEIWQDYHKQVGTHII